MKRTGIIICVTAVFGIFGLVGFSGVIAPHNFSREAALKRGDLYDVRIVRDAFGVPHVYGERDVDAAFGFAYAQAEDNIRNIERSFKFARGQMGEMTGRDGAKTDYLISAMRVRETFLEKYESDLSPKVRAVLDAYADGINFYCAEKPRRCTKGFAPLTGREVASAPKTRGPFVFGLDDVLTELFRDARNAGEGVTHLSDWVR